MIEKESFRVKKRGLTKEGGVLSKAAPAVKHLDKTGIVE